MSDGMNKVILLGNLGSDPELRYTTTGVAVMNMRLATNETYVDKNKEPQARTEWHTVVVWGSRAEGLSRLLTKGSSVVVEGALRTSSYEKEGSRRYRTEIHARDILFAGRRAVPGGHAASALRENLGDEPPGPESFAAEVFSATGAGAAGPGAGSSSSTSSASSAPARARTRGGFGPPSPALKKPDTPLDELPY